MRIVNNKSFKPLLLICFFLSGFCGLMFEVAWLRVLSVIFGNTTFATSTILAGYMAGLGLGALYFGRYIERSEDHPIRIYGHLEGGVAVYAFLTPLIWILIEWIHIGFFRTVHPSYTVFSLFKFVMAFVFLFIPTFLMGGTLPVVAKFFVRRREEMARYVGVLYALNTFGAVAGVLFAGFFSIYIMGVWETVYFAGIFNLLIYFLFRNTIVDAGETKAVERAHEDALKREAEKAAVRSEEPQASSQYTFLLLLMFAFSGGVSMIYEVGWTRVLAIVLGSSVYAFTVMLATFLLGIAIGSYLFSLIAHRIKIDLFTFSFMQIATAVSVLIGLNYFDDVPFWFVKVYELSHGNTALMEIGRFIICALVMLVPTMFIGAIFTCFVHIYRGKREMAGDVGSAYFANTIGTIFGSASAGFFIIPWIGIQNALLLGAGINAAIGIITFFMHQPNLQMRRCIAGGSSLLCFVIAFALVQPWNRTILASETAVKPFKAVGISRDAFLESFKERQILYYKEGVSATVTVARLRDNISLAVNGKVDASNMDVFTQYLLGHLPMILHGNAKDVLVIGLGSASTVAAAASYPAEHIDAVELEPAVVEASSYFPELNRHVLEDPRVEMHVNDGRNFLLVRPDKYDVIISEPSNPWMAGVANLFSYEHFLTTKKRLKPGGISCQWLHAYSMSVDDLAMIINTYTEAFEHVQLWTSYYPDLILIGSREPLTFDLDRIQKTMDSNPFVEQDLAEHGVEDADSLFASFWLDDATLRAMARGAKMHTDNKPLLEFSAPRNLYRATGDENYYFLNAARSFDYDFLNLDPPASRNTDFLLKVARSLLVKKMYKDAAHLLDKIEKLEPGLPKTMEIGGILSFQVEQDAQAMKLFERAIELDPSLVEAHFFRGELLMKQNQYEKAVADIRFAFDADPDNEIYLQGLALVLYEKGDYEESLALYKKLYEIRPHFDVVNKLVDLSLRISPMDEKIRIMKMTTEVYPLFAPPYALLGELYEANDQIGEAMLAYEKYSELMPDDSGAFLSLAKVYDRLGRHAEMKEAVRRAIEIEPKLKNHPEIQKIL